MKTAESLSEICKQFMELVDFYLKDMEPHRYALLKVAKWEDSTLLEFCERGFQIYVRNTGAAFEVAFRNLGILIRNIEIAINAIPSEETMTEEDAEYYTNLYDMYNFELKFISDLDPYLT